MDDFLSFVNDLLKNRVEDIYGNLENGRTIPFSPLSTILDRIGVNIQYKEAQEINRDLQKFGKKKKHSPYWGTLITLVSGFAFYYLWLEQFLGLESIIVKLFLTMFFTDIVFAIYGYFRYKNSVKAVSDIFGEFHYEVSSQITDTDRKILTKLHIPLPDAKVESYQKICQVLKNNHIVFPAELDGVRDEINYLKKRQEEGVLEIGQDEVCVIFPK